MKKSKIHKSTVNICLAALIAAIYVTLSELAAMLGLFNGAIQIRFSEALCVLPYFTFAAVPGVTLGCLISNLFLASAPGDIIFGTLATLIGALLAYALRKFKWLVPLPTILANTLIIPFVLRYAYSLEDTIPYLMLTVCIGEVISVYALGMPLLFGLKKSRVFNKINA